MGKTLDLESSGYFGTSNVYAILFLLVANGDSPSDPTGKYTLYISCEPSLGYPRLVSQKIRRSSYQITDLLVGFKEDAMLATQTLLSKI